MANARQIDVHIAASADGYIARPDGDLEWLTSRPAPKGFYGMDAFMRSLGAKFDGKSRHIVLSHQPPPGAPPSVEFTNEGVRALASRLREEPGKNIWLMGGGEVIASFLDEDAIDEFVVSVVPVFIGDGIPLIARRHRQVPLTLRASERFDNGVVQLHYDRRQGVSVLGS